MVYCMFESKLLMSANLLFLGTRKNMSSVIYVIIACETLFSAVKCGIVVYWHEITKDLNLWYVWSQYQAREFKIKDLGK